MADISSSIDIIEEYYDVCTQFDDIDILDQSKSIAFYNAMIDAAKDDPMDDAEDQAALLEYLRRCLKEHVETYQQLVNAKLP